MAIGEKVTVSDEDERIRQHESVKDDVRQQVHSDIAREARSVPVDPAREQAAAETMKREALDEVTVTEREVARGRTAARGSQFVDYIFYLAYGLITLAIVLEAIGARESAGFKQFVDAAAAPLVAPFRGIMNDPAVGTYQLMLSYVVALVAYILLHMAINGLLRLFAERKTAV
jgi:uncharacterized protein YggT (Ycf19 family)